MGLVFNSTEPHNINTAESARTFQTSCSNRRRQNKVLTRQNYIFLKSLETLYGFRLKYNQNATVI